MSVFAWWEWLALTGLVSLAWLIGYSSGEHYGRAKAAREAAWKIMDTLESIATKQNDAAEKLTTVCEMFKQTVILLDKIGKRARGES